MIQASPAVMEDTHEVQAGLKMQNMLQKNWNQYPCPPPDWTFFVNVLTKNVRRTLDITFYGQLGPFWQWVSWLSYQSPLIFCSIFGCLKPYKTACFGSMQTFPNWQSFDSKWCFVLTNASSIGNNISNKLDFSFCGLINWACLGLCEIATANKPFKGRNGGLFQKVILKSRYIRMRGKLTDLESIRKILWHTEWKRSYDQPAMCSGVRQKM